jgi:hypothetical protein
MIHEALRHASTGRIKAQLDSDELAGIERQLRSQNRRISSAVLSAGLLIASAVLAAYDVGPWFQDNSVPALIGFGIALLVGLQAMRR